MKNEPVILGIDIGGTKVALAKVSETGRLLSQKRYPLRASSVLDFPRTLCEQIEIFLGDERPLGIGVGLKGMIAADCHTILHSSILSELLPYDLCSMLSQRFGAPCCIDNDVHAATLAEIEFGCGRAQKDFVFINLGTGMAVGIVTEGRLLRGAQNLAGELGACTAIREDGGEYPLETLISGEGLVREAMRLQDRHPKAQLAQSLVKESATGREVLAAHRTGDPLALEAVDHLLEALSRLLCNLTLLLDPALFVFGGGVVSDGYLLSLLRPRMAERHAAQGGRGASASIALSEIGSDEIGVLGAASVFLNARGALTRKE